MKNNIILLLLGLVLSSCGSNLRYFTSDLYDEYRWTEDELKSIQFYISEDIVLYRQLSSDNVKIDKGKIVVKNGNKVEEIYIERGTPGILVVHPKTEHLGISFESRDNGKFIMFGPNKNANGRFVVLAKDWNQSSGKITYGELVYETSSRSAYAALMVDLKRARKTQYKTRKAEGSKVKR